MKYIKCNTLQWGVYIWSTEIIQKGPKTKDQKQQMYNNWCIQLLYINNCMSVFCVWTTFTDSTFEIQMP